MSGLDISARVDEIGAAVDSLSEEVRRLSVVRAPVSRCLSERDEVAACKDVLRSIEQVCTFCPVGDARLLPVLSAGAEPLLFGGIMSMAQCQAFLGTRLRGSSVDLFDFALRVFRRLTGLYLRESRPVNPAAVVVLVCKFNGRVVFATMRGGVRNTWPFRVYVEFPDVPVMTYVRSGDSK